MKNAIKLLKIGELRDGTERFCSQLYVGKGTADFIKRKGEDFIRCYGNGENGFDFYPYNKPFIIVDNILEMKIQSL